ncbi:MAG TPA: hypothetical protein VJT15_16385, partial [Pyrinomonadaceae bacterium]|nr:hypothetical protein [Pyrinomonadaceae bacterium]
HKLYSLIHDTLSSPRHPQLLLPLQPTPSTVKDVMITICKACHDNEQRFALAPGYPMPRLWRSTLKPNSNSAVAKPSTIAIKKLLDTIGGVGVYKAACA